MTLSRENLGKLIKKARNLKGEKLGKKFTQKDLAKLIGKSRSYIGDVESGRTYPSYVLLSEIAKACEVSLDFFNIDETINNYVESFSNLNSSEKKSITNLIKTDNHIKVNDLQKSKINNFYFNNAQDAIKFILEQPAIMAYGGYDLEDMDEEEILELANDMLLTLKVSLERKKNK